MPNMFDLSRAFDSIDHKAALAEVARLHPAVFMECATRFCQPGDDADYVRSVIGSVRHGDFITAIKTVREKTGAGLLEAKLAVDAMRGRVDSECRHPSTRRVVEDLLAPFRHHFPL